MSSDRDTTRLVRSWLEEGVTALPDRVLDGVLDRVPETRQRRAWWSGWRFGVPNAYARASALAAPIILLAVLGLTVLPMLAPQGGPQSSPSPSPAASPTAQASPSEPPEPPLAPGTHSPAGFPVGLSYTVGPGWLACVSSKWEQGPCREKGSGMVQFIIVDNVVADPCGDALRDPPLGPSVDELVAALSGLPGFTTTAPIDVTVGGLAGKEFTLTAPSTPGCAYKTWATPDRINGVGLGEANLIRIVDVDGTRVMMAGPYSPAAADAPQAIELIRQVMDSVSFTR